LEEFIQHAVSLDDLPDTRKKPERVRLESEPSVPIQVEEKKPEAEVRPTPPIHMRTKRKNWVRIEIDGFPDTHHDELGLVGLFTVLCTQGRI